MIPLSTPVLKSQLHGKPETDSSVSSVSPYLCKPNTYTPADAFTALCRASRKAAEDKKAAGGWQSPTWYFVRALKADIEFRKKTAEQFMQTVPWMTTDFDADERLLAYLEWSRVSTADGDNPLARAALLADHRPVPITCALFDSESFSRFLNICFHLQRLQKDSDVYLPVHSLAPILEVSAMAVCNYRSAAKSLGYLRETVKSTRRRATRFRVNLEKFPTLEADA